jgi:3-methylfumaryl-CoA hydratase
MFETDHAWPDRVAALAATLGEDTPPVGILPQLWHWLLFHDHALAASLGVDGHRAFGGLVTAPAGLPRRMWAGGRLRFHADITLGQTISCESCVSVAYNRQGRSGPLRFVTITRKITAADGAQLLDEEQDLVYRALASVAAPASLPVEPMAGALSDTIVPDTVMLFRFSALTFNAHRIHYDADFCRDVEHYPGIVVHAPLQAILLARHLQRVAPPHCPRRFTYRGVTPAFAEAPLTLQAWPDADAAMLWHLRSLGPAGEVCMTAEAELSPAGSTT